MDERDPLLNRLRPIAIPEGCVKPHARSGHRSVANQSALYVFGGYHGDGHKLFREIWKFDVHREEWECIQCSGDGPTSVASSSVVMSGDVIITFGGSGVPFGYSNSNEIHLLSIKSHHWSRLQCSGNVPESQYGTSAALTRYGQIVLFGGTSGSLFNADVHILDLRTKSYKEVKAMGAPKPRYRHEVVWDDDRFYTIGGCTLREDFPFDIIHSFEYDTMTWHQHHCSPAMSDGFPSPRRFHSCAKYGDNVYMCGGTTFLDHIYNDVWRLDLTTFQWTKMWQTLPTPVFFPTVQLSLQLDVFMYLVGA
ncbi:kelch domain-containing protein 10-like [Corticium candelabrum]|uniref:kelch domain-containing protein 10-like n=1 Tax=Corticium candelabrum TaxID=121492 RepID=UPI002E25B4AA|nr:kelch domain-containing protein 10-like [Corticium candelabrum]